MGHGERASGSFVRFYVGRFRPSSWLYTLWTDSPPMMPRKKLEYYAKKNGFEYKPSIRVNAEQVEAICKAVGTGKVYGMSDCGGSLSNLIDRVMDDEGFRAKHRKEGVSEDFLLARYPDYAAEAVMAEYAKLIGKA